jgi:hypothetical protein
MFCLLHSLGLGHHYEGVHHKLIHQHNRDQCNNFPRTILVAAGQHLGSLQSLLYWGEPVFEEEVI